MMLTELEKFEVKAEAFRIMTGMMAPGKDVGMFACRGVDYEDERRKVFDEWWQANFKAVQAMLTAFDRVMNTGT